MRKYLFIINPVAGKGATKGLITKLKETFGNEMMDIKLTKCVGDATIIAKEHSASYTDIISVGGDGTLTEVINGLKNFTGRLGIIPAGTGNDFARSINMPIELEACLEIIKINQVKKVDVAYANDKAFINVASFGIDGGIILDTDKIKNKISGSAAYVLSSLKGIFTYKPFRVKLEIDGEKLDRDIVLVAVANGKYFGGGMMIAPMAEIDDGLLEIIIANKTKKHKLLDLFTKLFNGSHMSHEIVEHYRCKEFRIESDDSIYINTDGNLIGKVPAEIKLNTEKIHIIIP